MDKELEQKIITVMQFDGWGKVSNDKGRYLRPRIFNIVCPLTLHESDNLEHTCYHTSWQWIHSVWEKFRNLRHNLSGLSIRDHYEHSDKIGNAISYGTELQAFTALHDGIKWFNEINKQQ